MKKAWGRYDGMATRANVSRKPAYSTQYASDKDGFTWATLRSLALYSGSFVFGWLYPMGDEAMKVMKSRRLRPLLES